MEEQDRQGLLRMDEHSWYDVEKGKIVFLSLEDEVEYKKEALESINNAISAYDMVGVAGKIGVVYLGLRTMGTLFGVGPEINTEELSIPDTLGGISAYLGGMCWLIARGLQLAGGRSTKKDYENALERLTKQSSACLDVVNGEV